MRTPLKPHPKTIKITGNQIFNLFLPSVKKAAVFTALLTPISIASAQDAASAVEEIVSPVERVTERAFPSLVRIEVLMEKGESGRMRKQVGFGSGAIISKEGHVLTNHHVAGRGTRFLCTLVNRETIPARMIGTDALSDLAIIQLDLSARRDTDAPVPVAQFGDSDQLEVGDLVFALGSPAALSQSVTKGIVANTEMISPKTIGGGLILDGERVGELVRWIGHDAIIFGGNSGGPLVNEEGLIIGVNEVGIGSLGGAIPGNLSQKVAQELIEHGEITRSWIGLEIQPLLRSMKSKKGALVATVYERSPALEAGILPGDFIQQFDGETVPDCRSDEDLPLFNAMVLGCPVGKEVQLTGERDGKEMTWTLTSVVRHPTVAVEEEFVSWGMNARDITPVSALNLKRPDDNGVRVHSIRPGGAVAKARPPLAPGDVITALGKTAVNDLTAFRNYTEEFTANLEKPEGLLVTFERGRSRDQLVTVVELGPEQKRNKPVTADKGWLGASLQLLTPELIETLELPIKTGLRVTRVATGSPAAASGIKPGDLILNFGGQQTSGKRASDLARFKDLVAAYEPDSEVKATIFKFASGEEKELTLQLIARPQDEDDAETYKDSHFELTVRDLTTSWRDVNSVSEEVTAVRVTEVTANGWASLAGIRNGDLILAVNGTSCKDAESFENLIAPISGEKAPVVSFRVLRGVKQRFLEIEPTW